MTTVPARGIAMVNRIETAASGGTRSRSGLVMASGRRESGYMRAALAGAGKPARRRISDVPIQRAQ